MAPNNTASSTAENIKKLILLKKFAHVEDLAHTLGYDNSLKDGETIELLDYNGQPLNALVRRIPINNPSIVAHILEIKSNDPNLPNKVEVIWRGTHDKGSAIADLDPTSPGYSEYMNNRSIILSEVNKSIGRLSLDNKNVAVGSYGHSLGGSLAQVFAVDVMDAKAQQHNLIGKSSLSISPKERSNFGKVKEITIGTFNAAGVSKETANRASELETLLHSIKTQDQPKISYFAALNAGDGVQQTGEASILADSTESKVYLLKTNVKQTMFYKILIGALSIGGALLTPKIGPFAAPFAKIIDLGKKTINTVNAHTATLFDKAQNIQSNVINFELLTNEHPAERALITQKLNNKAKILQNPVLKTFQATIYYFTDKLLNKHHTTKHIIPPPTITTKLSQKKHPPLPITTKKIHKTSAINRKKLKE